MNFCGGQRIRDKSSPFSVFVVLSMVRLKAPQLKEVGLTSGSVLRTLEGLDDALLEPMMCPVIALTTIFPLCGKLSVCGG